VSITPFGKPVVPDEYGSTTTSTAGSISGSGGSASSAIESSEGEPSLDRPGRLADRRAHLVGERRRREHELRPGVVELLRELVARIRGVDRRHDRTEPHDRVERDGEVGRVRRTQRDDVALADAERREPGGRAPHSLGELPVGEYAAGRTVDERRLTGMLAGRSEDEVRERAIRNGDVGVGAAEHHRLPRSLGAQAVETTRCLGPSPAFRLRPADSRRRISRAGE
jgi:hypothetical protein